MKIFLKALVATVLVSFALVAVSFLMCMVFEFIDNISKLILPIFWLCLIFLICYGICWAIESEKKK